MSLTDADHKTIDDIEKQAIASIEGQNWTDPPLTDTEKRVIGMAVAFTYSRLLGSLRRY